MKTVPIKPAVIKMPISQYLILPVAIETIALIEMLNHIIKMDEIRIRLVMGVVPSI